MSSGIYRPGVNPAQALYRQWRLVMRDPSGLKDDRIHNVPYGRGVLDGRGDWIDLDFTWAPLLSIRPNGDFRIGWMAGAMKGEDRRWKLYHSSFLDFFPNEREGYSWVVKPCFRPDFERDEWRAKWGQVRDHKLRMPHVPEWAIAARDQSSSSHPWLRLEPDEAWGWRIELAKRQNGMVDHWRLESVQQRWGHMVEHRERQWARSLRQWEIRTGVRTPPRQRKPPTTVSDTQVAQFAAAFDLTETFVHTPLREAQEAHHDNSVVQPLLEQR